MNNYMKFNVLLKILTVIIIGYFFFELLFGVVAGNFGVYGNSGGGEPHHASSNSGGFNYSFDIFINALVVMLVKLLIVLFFIILIAGAAKWIKDIWVDKGIPPQKGIEKDGGSLLIITGAALGILTLLSIVGGFNGYENLDYGNFLEVFINVLMYIISAILGVELFTFFYKKVNKREGEG